MKNRREKHKFITALIALTILIVTAIGPEPVRADMPYRTYTVDGYGTFLETQAAYIPYNTIIKVGDEALKNPADFTITDDGLIYILDTGNKRVVVSDMDANLVDTFGEGVLKTPRGIFVTDEHVTYVADRDAKQIFVFDAEGELIKSYGRPDEAMYGESQDFLPLKIVVNSSGTMYVVCESNTNGIVEISPVEDGTFLGYFGTNKTDQDIWRLIKKSFTTEVQRAKWQSNLPSTPDNLAIDDKGVICTVTRGEKADTLKRLNIAGVNMINGSKGSVKTSSLYYCEVPAAVAVGNHENIFVVSQEGYIYEYTNEGELLFVFGGSDDGDQRIGLSTMVTSIKIASDDKIYVLDSDKARLQIYEPTEFASYLHEALNLFSKGRYTESKEPLTQVLGMNNLFDYANMAMSKALYKEGNYEESLKYARLAKDRDVFSDSFWEIRNDWLRQNLTTLVIILVVIAVVIKLLAYLDRKKRILEPARLVLGHIRDRKLMKELGYMFFFMRHPIDGCYGIKHEKKVSLLSSNILLATVIIFYIINKYFCGFLLKTVKDGSYDIFSDAGLIILVLLLLVGSNYLMCAINDGEGKIKDIYCSFIYSISPYIVFMPFIFALSHVVTENETFFTDFGTLFMYVWCGVLLFISIKEINDYTIGETLKIIGLTIFTALIICLLVFIIYVLCSQLFDFLQQIPREVVYRIGS